MDIGVLGGLVVRVGGNSVVPSAPKPRQVLAVLALRVGQLVPVSVLVEELWGSAPPRSARTTLQTYVLQLRELIAGALESEAGGSSPSGAGPEPGSGSGMGRRRAKDVLVTVPGGYVLAAGAGAAVGTGAGAGGSAGESAGVGAVCDVGVFEEWAGLGYRALDGGDFAGAAGWLRRALGLWSGAAFADVARGPVLEVEAKRLEESRLCALDRRIEADLRLGRHRELLAELTVLVNGYRTHESLHAQFMLALHRSGRRGEALDVYERLRARLVGDLGLEPSVRLRRLQRSILMAGREGAVVGRGGGSLAAAG
ncbi:AfsR/SARP family transcriptional regulator [Streptomyces sp. NPDC048518]|uniref:AfsR/SARP family transcriptional regulator n=1 Tax=Streptomyces sp. NPDC048518 TaxID=3155029 RepID=UPI0033E22596